MTTPRLPYGPPWKGMSLLSSDTDDHLARATSKAWVGATTRPGRAKDYIKKKEGLVQTALAKLKKSEADGPFWSGGDGDQTDALANNKAQFLQFYHLPSGHAVAFKAFVTRYEDTYNSEWNAQPVYGRMDPIATFRRTGRVINAGFTIPSVSIQEAMLNLQNVSELVRFLYPSYDADGTIKGAPFLKFQFMNWAQKSSVGPGTDPKESGLLGYVNGFQFAPDLEAGVHQAGLEIYPKAMTVSFRFTVIHEQITGWSGDQFIGKGKFPYGLKSGASLGFTKETMSAKQKSHHDALAKANASIILNG